MTWCLAQKERSLLGQLHSSYSQERAPSGTPLLRRAGRRSPDSDPKTDATTHDDIFNWDHTDYPPEHFDATWSNPCWTHYYCARRGAKTPHNLERADSFALRTFEIISYFNPRAWFIEKPQTRALKDTTFMSTLPYTDADYCCYCLWGCRKRTLLWNNVDCSGKLCLGRGVCPNMDGNKNIATAQRGRSRCKT